MRKFLGHILFLVMSPDPLCLSLPPSHSLEHRHRLEVKQAWSNHQKQSHEPRMAKQKDGKN